MGVWDNDPDEPTLVPEALDHTLRCDRPCTIFVCSMSDLFQDAVPDEYIQRVFSVMRRSGMH